MVTHLGVTQAVVVKNCKDEYGVYVSYKTLKNIYKDHLDATTRLRDVQVRDRHRTSCVKCYLLCLVGCLLFGDKSNKHIKLIYLTTMEDYARMCDYSWGWMTWHTYTIVYRRFLCLMAKLLGDALHYLW